MPISPTFFLRFLAAAALLTLCVSADAATPAKWSVVKIGGRDYIPGKQIKTFYGFTKYSVSGKKVTFQMPGFWMQASIGSRDVLIKGVRFILSYPVAGKGSDAYFSRTDLVKLIDPVFRPDYIRGGPDFNTVVIDAGHGGHDSGAVGPYGREKDFALKTALRTAAILKAKGYKIVLTRSSDKFVTLKGRVAIANKYPRSIFVSIHFNDSNNKSARGIETFALSPAGTTSNVDRWGEKNLSTRTGNRRDAENIALATAVHNGVLRRITSTKPIDRGIKRARFSVISGIKSPGILFEGGFVGNRLEGKLVANARYQQMLAEGIARGVENFRRALK